MENLLGSTLDDTLLGDGDANLIDGRPGNDSLDGGRGADTVLGNTGFDWIEGGRVADFVSGLDRISLAGLGLTFVPGGLPGVANQIIYRSDFSLLSINLNGGGTADRVAWLLEIGTNFNAATNLIL